MERFPHAHGGPLLRGVLRAEPADFIVEEQLGFEPAGAGEHVFVQIEKAQANTDWVAQKLGAFARVAAVGVGYAGLKDRHAVTRQWISLHLPGRADPDWAAFDVPGVRVLQAVRHDRKLKRGAHRGNRFRIRLRSVSGDTGSVESRLAAIGAHGVPNYFGEQRFGKRGANLQKGLDILRGNARAFAARMPRRVFGLVVSAVQSEVFNRVVAARRHEVHRLMPGDLAFLHKNGAVFAVEDAAREQPRADRFELSPSGPMPGPDMAEPTGEPLRIEREALAALDLSPEQFAGLPFRIARGERRPLRVPVTEASAAAVEGGLRLSFTLPRGAYATAVLRELLTDTIWFAERD